MLANNVALERFILIHLMQLELFWFLSSYPERIDFVQRGIRSGGDAVYGKAIKALRRMALINKDRLCEL